MKRELLAVVVCAVAMSAVARADEQVTPTVPAPTTEETKAGTPKIEFAQTVYDFGTTSLVDSVTGTFTFTNVGDGILKVEKPSTSCGCTVAGVKPDSLKPGEKGELVFTLRVAGMRGHAEKSITVPSNDPANPSMRLTVKADVKQIFEVDPQQVMIGDIRPGAITNVTLKVRRTDGKDLSITKTEGSSNNVRVRVLPQEGENKQGAELAVEFESEGTPRRFNEQVRVFADDAAQPVAVVGLHGRILGDVVLTPEALFWGIVDRENWPGDHGDSMTTRRVVVSSTLDSKPLELKNVASSLKDVTVEVVPMEAGKSYAVVAKLPTPPVESERGTISFDTNIDSQPQVVVPVTINVLKR